MRNAAMGGNIAIAHRLSMRTPEAYSLTRRRDFENGRIRLQIGAGYGEWIDRPTTERGGHPTRVFHERDNCRRRHNPLKTREKRGFVDSRHAYTTRIRRRAR